MPDAICVVACRTSDSVRIPMEILNIDFPLEINALTLCKSVTNRVDNGLPGRLSVEGRFFWGVRSVLFRMMIESYNFFYGMCSESR